MFYVKLNNRLILVGVTNQERSTTKYDVIHDKYTDDARVYTQSSKWRTYFFTYYFYMNWCQKKFLSDKPVWKIKMATPTNFVIVVVLGIIRVKRHFLTSGARVYYRSTNVNFVRFFSSWKVFAVFINIL